MIPEETNQRTGRGYKKEEPYLCLDCRQVWQYTENHLHVEYIGDFPKYGCTPRICDICKKKESKSEIQKGSKEDRLLQRSNNKTREARSKDGQRNSSKGTKSSKKRRGVAVRTDD